MTSGEYLIALRDLAGVTYSHKVWVHLPYAVSRGSDVGLHPDTTSLSTCVAFTAVWCGANQDSWAQTWGRPRAVGPNRVPGKFRRG